MEEEVTLYLDDTKDNMEKAIVHLQNEMIKLRAGKANPNMLDHIFVDYYGVSTILSQIANINTPDAKSIVIQPWEKKMIAPIEKAIMASNIGLNPQNDGNLIRLFLPPLTEERRREFAKRAFAEGEHAKVAVRSIRRENIEEVKKLQKDGLSEDIARNAEGQIQGITDKFIALIDQHCKDKEKDIMTI